MSEMISEVKRRLPWALLMALVGGLGFVWAQAAFAGAGYFGAGKPEIPRSAPAGVATAIGQRIVDAGEYAEKYVAPIGWTTHLVISFSYALLIATLVALPFYPRSATYRGLAHLIGAGALGWVTAIITSPAIGVTVSVLGGRGLPDKLSPLYFTADLTLWVHIGFFALGYLVVGVLPDLFTRRRGE